MRSIDSIYKPALFALLLISSSYCQQQKQVVPLFYPAPHNYVSDFCDTLQVTHAQQLNKRLAGYADSTTTQIFVAILDSLSPGHSLEEGASVLFGEWKPGTVTENNGVLFLILPSNRVMRLQIGYGLETVLTDKRCEAILDEFASPFFKEGDLIGGIRATVKELIAFIDAEWKPELK